MKVGIPAEIFPGEHRVAATPETARRLIEELHLEVLVQAGAGQAASFPDQAYRQAGCTLVDGPQSIWGQADVVLKVRPPSDEEIDQLRPGQTLIGFLAPAQFPQRLQRIAERGATAVAMDAVPRISRAQKLDALTSMANIAGYRAVVEAAGLFGRFFTGQITAAGKLPPAKVLVIGAGVAGLAAIGTARGLGAIVRAFDVRPEVADQIKSMGAEFLQVTLEHEEPTATAGGYAKSVSQAFIDAEMALFAAQAKQVDIIITTALIPGKRAPTLITREMVESMQPGSVIVDLAAEQGGNCEVTRPDEVISHQGVQVVGYTDLPSRLARTSSQLYGTNLFHLLDDLGGGERYRIDLQDVVIRSMTVVKDGEIIWPPPPVPVSAPSSQASVDRSAAERSAGIPATRHQGVLLLAAVTAAVLLLIGIGLTQDPGLITKVTVFVLACFVGWQVIWNVTPALHTPLMSVTNAISGIIVVGGMLQVGVGHPAAAILAAVAIGFATINIVGGFWVTQRMLTMFRR